MVVLPGFHKFFLSVIPGTRVKIIAGTERIFGPGFGSRWPSVGVGELLMVT